MNPLMWSSAVVILNIRRQNSMEMALIENHDPVEALLSDGANPALDERIGIGCLHWRPDDRHVL